MTVRTVRHLTANERIELRHHLQELSENALSVRNVMAPDTGVYAITMSAWREQLKALTKNLETVTSRIETTPLDKWDDVEAVGARLAELGVDWHA